MEEKTAINGVAPFLPEEIITNILKRLPVKSLMRFQCVCKDWKNLFKSPSFISDHLYHSTHHNPSLLIFQGYRIRHLQVHMLDCEMQVRDVQNASLFDSLIIGSSNGLICAAINKPALSSCSILLWNPATRDIREVPRSRTINSSEHGCVFGFGFSSFVNDYKVVAIDRKVWTAGVYSLSRDSWKEIETGMFFEGVIFHETVLSYNGAIFWNVIKPAEEGDDEGVIISFDIAMEAFTLIPRPRGRPLNSYVNLTMYKGKLALLYGGKLCSRGIDLWVLEEDIGSSRERWSWNKKFTCIPCPWTVYFGGTIWRNEIVMSGTKAGEYKERRRGICLLNFTTNEFKRLIIPVYGGCEFLNYVESLAPVVNIHKDEEP